MNRKTSLRGLIGLAIATAPVASFAQPAIAWTRTTALTLASQNTCRFVKTDSAGNTFLARLRGYRNTGSTFGYTQVQKFSAAGALVWTVNLVGQGSGVGLPVALLVDSNGNVIVGEFDFYSMFATGMTLTKLNGGTGAKLWQTTTFTLTFNGQTTAALDSSNNVFMLGQTGVTGDVRIAVTKINGGTGAALWSKPVVRVGANQSDFASSLEVDAGNNVAVVGTVESSDPCNTTFKSPIVVGRLRGTDGATLWAKTYTNLATDDNTFPLLDVDSSSNVYVGSSVFRNPSTVWILAKMAASNGALSYARVYNPATTFLSFMSDLECDGSGGVVLAGAGFGMAGAGTVLQRFTQAGGTSWSKLLADRDPGYPGGIGGYSPRLIAFSTSLYLCATRDTTVGQTPTSVTIANKLVASTGANSWERIYNGAGNSQTTPTGLAVAPNGDAVIGNSVSTGNPANPFIQGALVRMTSGNGSVVFNNIAANTVIGTPDYGRDVLVDPSAFVFTTGGSGGRILTQKFNSAGTLIWQNIFDDVSTVDLSDETDGGLFVARDPGGNVVVLGTNRGKVRVIKHSNTTGGVIWSKSFDGEAGENLAINSSGDIYVPMKSPAKIMKLAGATGATLWTGPFDGPLAGDSCHFVGLDSTGNPFATGLTVNSSICPGEPDERVVVQRSNPSTGAKVWQTVLATTNAGHHSPVGIALDSSKNVLVGGTSSNATNTDFFAAKLNGTSGAVLWNTKHDDSARMQYATALVLDGANNLVVTGATYNGATVEGFTIKVLNSTGARSWTNRVNSPAGNKVATDVARDGSNNVYIGGGLGTATTGQRFARKINTTNGTTIWTGLSNGAVGSLGLISASVAVSSTNRLHVVGANNSAGTGLSNQVLYQYNP